MMKPQTQNRLAALAIGAGTMAYLGYKQPWIKTQSKPEDVPESKLPSTDHGKFKKEMQEKKKSDEPQKRNWWFNNPKK